MNDGNMSTRRRDKMPRRLYFMALLFLFLPIGNYLVTNISQDESVFDIFGFLHQHNTMGVILICAPFFLGVALFFVRKWGYFLVLCYAAFLAIYNLVVAIQSRQASTTLRFLHLWPHCYFCLIFYAKTFSLPLSWLTRVVFDVSADFPWRLMSS